MKRFIARRAAALVVAMALVSGAQAAPLGLTLFDFPDIFAGFVDVSYDALTQQLSASGVALSIDEDGIGPGEGIVGGSFDLDATVDAAGNLLGGNVSIGGTVPGLGYDSGTLITGVLSAFGFRTGGGDPLEFLFEITGGDAAAAYLANGARGGIILSASGFAGDWDNDWENGGAGLADIAPIPLPAGLWLLGSALLALLGRGATGPRPLP